MLVCAGMAYGVLVHRWHLPPYGVLKAVHEAVSGQEPPPPRPTAPPEQLATDISPLLGGRGPTEARALRRELNELLWDAPTPPDSLRASVERGIVDERYSGIRSLERIDRMSVSMEYGLNSVAYRFIPRPSNGALVLYHQGHDGDFALGQDRIVELLEHGYEVVALAMPLLGMNNQPVVELPGIGIIKLTSHEQMDLLDPAQGHPVKYFIEPVVGVLNSLGGDRYSSISMLGLSGGGWATTLAAAVDPRIELSIPVAGSYPIFLRTGDGGDWGDFEQTAPAVYSRVNYLELYVLGAYGAGRKQLQIFNEYDSCCFWGDRWTKYADSVAARVERLGAGAFEVLADSSHTGHEISSPVMQRILSELEAMRRRASGADPEAAG